MRGALLLLDFEDSSADSIKELLLSSLIEPLYLTSADGKKLLSYLFGLHPSFVDSLHQTSKSLSLLSLSLSHLSLSLHVVLYQWALVILAQFVSSLNTYSSPPPPSLSSS